jgi:ATP-binding cassette subfamily B protein
MKILLPFLKPQWRLVLFALFLASVNQIFSLLDPYIFRIIIDDYVTAYDKIERASFFRGAGLLILAAMGVAMVSRIAKNFQDYYVNVITQRIGARIYNEGLRHSLQLPYSDFEDQRSGETLGILQKVRTDTEKLIAAFVNILFISVVGIVFVVIYAINVYWPIAVVYFATMPVIGIISSVLSRKVKTVQKSIVAETTALAGSTTESLRNIELVKSLGLSQQEINRLNRTTDKILKLELRKVKYIRSLSFVQGTLVNFIRNSILFMMLYLIYAQKISVGDFFSLFIYSFFIFGPLQELGNIINIYRESEISVGNYRKLLSRPVEARPAHPVSIGIIGNMAFKNVMFQHASSNRSAINKISFEVSRGETIAFAGPSGSGKTTLVKLLVGLYTPVEGEVCFNGVSGKEINYDDLRERIGLVTQDTQLFSGTIRENLLFVKPEATDADCMRVLDMAACQGLMSRADRGLDTLIGEGGVKVSGGERQRLSIARALLRNPEILVFDEATSALDSLTEEEITATIRSVSASAHQITVLIAHRLSTIMHADRIYVLERGEIIESGSHDELLMKGGLYQAMWRQQIGEALK